MLSADGPALAKIEHVFHPEHMGPGEAYELKGGRHRRVHKEYVDVLCRCCHGGQLEPLAIIWKDGRRFPIDEWQQDCGFGRPTKGLQVAKWTIRLGGHTTHLWLERRAPDKDAGVEETMRWWVLAYDEVKPGTARPKAPEPAEAEDARGIRRSKKVWEYED